MNGASDRAGDRDTDRAAFDDFYGRKWADGPMLWQERYPADQRVYAVSVYRRRNEAIMAALPAKSRAALDVGCGAGDVALMLSRRAPHVVAVDVSAVNVEATARNARVAGVRLSPVGTGGERMPFRDGSFDAVVVADVIEHIDDADAALAEIYRIMSSGGTMVCVTPLRRTLGAFRAVDWLARTIARPLRPTLPRFSSDQVYERFLDKGELRAMLRRAGFLIERYERICCYPAPETGGALGSLMRRIAARQSEERFVVMSDRMIAWLDAASRLRIFNQKQMWVVRR